MSRPRSQDELAKELGRAGHKSRSDFVSKDQARLLRGLSRVSSRVMLRC